MNSYKVLLVDDDEYIRKIYTDRFIASGLNVTTAGSGHDAEKLLEKNSYDLICLDYMLADKTGLDILIWIKKTREITTPVIIFSASGHEHKIEEFMAAGATEYIQKDHVVPSELVTKIKSIIDSKKHA